MFGLGLWEGLIILIVVLLMFGGSRLPKLGSALGQAMVNFKKGLNEKDEDDPENKQNKDKLDKK